MTQNQTGRGHVVVVFGSTGRAGTGAVHACLAEPSVSEVRTVTRRPLGVSHDKLNEVICSDFANLGGIAQQLRGVDCCLFCLGTSVRNVKGEDQYREIHVTYALAAARTLLAESPHASFVYLSGAGTKRTSRMMWARVKAEAEDGLAELKLARHVNVRPAAILPMQPTGATRWLLAPLLKVIPALGINSVDLGRAMLRVGLDKSWNGNRTLENEDLKALLREGPQR
ncbi:hypothetical protein JRI60_43845 [Archangium violaceum]|uniref:hypothetical protein n=1 Tax=Archangium violaceum TaxID=83451 RepID=UPI001950EA4E|nr:hypothetical protein [Archangium violaceum]QRN95908.1 hypothetical protein JRI60_43845 [Archangium violaceum]